MSYKLTFLVTQDITKQPDFEMNCLFSYLDKEGAYMGKEKKSALTRKQFRKQFSSKLSLCFYIKNTTWKKLQELCKELEEVHNFCSPQNQRYMFISSSTCYFTWFYQISINGRGTKVRHTNFAANINSAVIVCNIVGLG